MIPVKRPIPACTGRLTSSGSRLGMGMPLSAIAFASASACAVSNAIARSTGGSPTSFKKPNPRRPASTPTIIPRSNSAPVITAPPPWSVAGKAQQMPSVVDEFVHVHAVEQRCRALLDPDEIDRQRGDEAAKDQPGQQFAQRDGRGP